MPTETPVAILDSIKNSAAVIGHSEWFVKDLLRRGKLKAVKAGRRTLVIVASRDDYVKSLEPATYLPPRQKRNAEGA
jgi:hypothetical protein